MFQKKKEIMYKFTTSVKKMTMYVPLIFPISKFCTYSSQIIVYILLLYQRTFFYK